MASLLLPSMLALPDLLTGTSTLLQSDSLPTLRLRHRLLLGKRFDIKTRLGRGAHGEVWRAWDLVQQKYVALKVLWPKHSPVVPGDLKREFLIGKSIDSPFVCKSLELFYLDGLELLSMEYLQGQSLLSFLSETWPEENLAEKLAGNLLQGLQAIHQAGFIHGDLRAKNVIWTTSGKAVLIDFGSAQKASSQQQPLVDALTQKQTQERIRRDLFGAAVLCSRLFVQECALVQDSEVVHKLLSVAPKGPGASRKSFLQRALAENSSFLYSSAKELAAHLQLDVFPSP